MSFEVLLLIRGVSTFIFCDLIFLPICIYHCYKFNQNIEDIIIQKRYGKVSVYEAISSILKLAINGIIFLFLGIDPNPHNLLKCVAAGISNCCSICLHYCLFWRFYLLYFDIQCNIISINGKWQQLIDPNHRDSSDNNYFIKYKSTRGNYHWFKTRIILPLLIISCAFQISCCIYVGIVYDNQYNNEYLEIAFLLNSPLYIWPVIALIYIWFRTPKLEDQFFISQELNKLVKIVIIFFIFWITSHILLALPSFDNDPIANLWIFWIQTAITHCCVFLTVLISTFWVNKQILSTRSRMTLSSTNSELVPTVNKQSISNMLTKRNTISQIMNRVFTISSANGYDGDDANSPSNHDHDNNYLTSIQDETGHLRLTAILSHNKGFELFMRHLSTEFSLENLLSLVEFLQFQEMMYQCIINNDQFNDFLDMNQTLWFQKISLPTNVPKSYLIYEGQSVEDMLETLCDIDETQFIGIMKKMGYRLFLKYIANSAEFEVNIAYRTRLIMIEQMNDAGKWMDNQQIGIRELLHIFDKVCDQIYGLMGDSYRRFQKTGQYNIIKRLLLV